MTHRKFRTLAFVLAAMLCLSLALSGCSEEKADPAPVKKGDSSILPVGTEPKGEDEVVPTPVYATAFGSTVLLTTVPPEAYQGLERSCEPRDISNGGRILCGGEHEAEEPITHVLILDDLVPRNTCGWFRDMTQLEVIQGLGSIDTQYVTDMSYMFTNCKLLTGLRIDEWNVAPTVNMTGMFDGCESLGILPAWYVPAV